MSGMTKMGQDFCPFCEVLLDAASGIDNEAVPVPGDATICINCGELLEFDYDMALKPITEKLWDRLTVFQRMELMAAKRHIEIRGYLLSYEQTKRKTET